MSKDWKAFWGLLCGAFAASMLLLVSLFLSYNTYKEYMRSVTGFNPYTIELKAGIKAAFPISIIIFFALYVVFYSLLNSKITTTSKRYLLIIPVYLVIVNIINGNGLFETLIVLNVSVIYFVLLIFFFALAGSVARNQRLRQFFMTRPAESALYGFVVLTVISALLSAGGLDKHSAKVSNIAFLLFVSGLFIHVYKFVKHGGCDAKEE